MSNVCGTALILKAAQSAWILSLVTVAALGAMQVWHPAPPPRYGELTAVRARKVSGYRFVGDNPVSEPVKRRLPPPIFCHAPIGVRLPDRR